MTANADSKRPTRSSDRPEQIPACVLVLCQLDGMRYWLSSEPVDSLSAARVMIQIQRDKCRQAGNRAPKMWAIEMRPRFPRRVLKKGGE